MFYISTRRHRQYLCVRKRPQQKKQRNSPSQPKNFHMQSGFLHSKSSTTQAQLHDVFSRKYRSQRGETKNILTPLTWSSAIISVSSEPPESLPQLSSPSARLHWPLSPLDLYRQTKSEWTWCLYKKPTNGLRAASRRSYMFSEEQSFEENKFSSLSIIMCRVCR